EPDSLDIERPALDLSHTRSADLGFVEKIARSQSAQRTQVAFVTAPGQVSRLADAFREMGIASTTSPADIEPIFGTEQATHFLHAAGWSRTWHVDRLPGGELEPGWLHKMIPRGLNFSLAWHATPLPVAWTLEYLQRQLVGMRATRIQEHIAGTADPALAG